MKNQILEMLASPSVENALAFFNTLLRAPQESPLIAAVTAGLAGLLIAQLFASWRWRKRVRQLNDSWQNQLDKKDKSHKTAVTELQDSKDSLGKQVTTLQNKIQSTEKTLDQDRSVLHKVNASVKALEVSVAEKDQKLQQTIDDAAQKIAQHQASLKKANALLDSKTTELNDLKARLKGSSGLAISESLLNSINQRDEGYAEQLAKRIEKLDEQRSTLLQERDEFASREALYTDQLPDGDDTRIYLDDTVAIHGSNGNSIEIDTPADSTMLDELENTIAVDQPSVTPPRSVQSLGGTPSRETSDSTQRQDSTLSPSTLWNRVKTSVAKSTDKAKIEKSDA